MPIKKSLVSTSYTIEHESKPAFVPVFYTDELLDTSVYDLAFSSAHGGYLPYLFVGFFKTDKQEVGTWYFANARRHVELELAIKEDVKDKMQYVYGQIHFGTGYTRGQLQFRDLILHTELSSNEQDREDALRKLVSVIDPRDMEDKRYLKLVTGDEWKYVWTKSEKKLQRTK